MTLSLVALLRVGLALRALRPVAATASAMTCLNVGMQLQLQRHSQMPVEALSEITTGASCAKSSIVAEIMQGARDQLQPHGVELGLLDCVGTRMDEDALGMFVVSSVCSRNATADAQEWREAMRPHLQQVFRHVDPAFGGAALRYGSTVVQSFQLQVSPTYDAPSQARAPRFKFKSASLWAARLDGGSTIHLQLKAKNDGKTPLHVFAVAVKAPEDASLLGERVVVLTAEEVATVDPSKEATLTFQAQTPHAVQLPDDTRFSLYFAHSAVRPHVLEAKLDGKKLKPFDATKAAKKPTGLLDESVSLSRGSYPSTGVDGMWRVMSFAVVLIVGGLATMFMKRKWITVEWGRARDCLSQGRRLRPTWKTTEMTAMAASKKMDSDEDPRESDGFLAAEFGEDPQDIEDPPVVAKRPLPPPEQSANASLPAS
ncbi:hypothetical protein P43SY_007815 [Pythium insidiosum]|uniref:Uncharacterized protein n=1 Tax=Pythium insidiosum TaxID=114742 RepID=A0AAD5LUG2_PYTIN|nr:hypothetical protein P43SY_007815 [Pythium insidiosum]